MRWILLGLLVLALVGGFWWWKTRPLSPSELLAESGKYDQKHVRVSGRVGKGFSALLVNYYKLCDEKACLRVISNHAIPAEGAQTTVEGLFVASYGLGDKRLAVLMEGK